MAENPVLREFEPDVEALLVNRVGPAREYYRVGIDECYKLAGLIRIHWRGLSGGQAVWDEIGRFFAGLKERTHEISRCESVERRRPDLGEDHARPELPGGGCPARAVRGRAAARLQAARLRGRGRGGPADADPCRGAPLPDPHRAGPAAVRPPGSRHGSWTCSARRNAGARPCDPMLWTHVSAVVPPFSGTGAVDLPVACSYDFNLAATKYFAALEEGEIPLCFLFSGTIFYEAAEGALQVTQISWEKEAYFRLSAATWRGLMDLYYPNTATSACARTSSIGSTQYRSRRGLPTWEQAMERLLSAAEEPVTP